MGQAASSSPITIRDVAESAGVAVSTVSRVLNGSGYASAGTRDRVLDVAQQLGFRPSARARGLRRSRSMLLGMLIPDLSNPVFLQSLRGAEHVAQGRGYALMICDGQNSAGIQAEQIARLYEHRVDGLLLGGSVLALEALRPFVDAGIPIAPQPSLRGGQVELPEARTEGEASLAAFRSLVEAGHRRIALVGRWMPTARMPQLWPQRLQALRTALGECDAPFDPGLVVKAEDVDQCRRAVRELRARQQPPTAYVAATHIVAAPLLLALADAGLRLPEDVSFLSYGDSDWALAHQPPLSVIRHDYYADAAAWAENLVARIEQWPEVPPVPELAAEFVSRGSCGPAPR
jgi:LacI family transcriptional regulator